MGYEQMQRSSPCPCGQGRQFAEWEEHDTWSSGNEAATYCLECPDCLNKYTFFYSSFPYWVKREDKTELENRAASIEKLTSDAYQLIVERYEQRFVDHVKHLPNRTAMKRATFGGRGFLRRAIEPKFVERESRDAIRRHPVECYRTLELKDAEIDDALVELERLRKERAAFELKMPKIGIPDKRSGWRAAG